MQETNNQNVRVIFPPQFEPFQPYLSLPYLKGLLKIYGVDGKCFDANVDFYWWLFREYKKTRWQNSAQEEYLWSNIDNAVAVLKAIPQNIFKYRWAVNVTDEYLKAISPNGVRISLTSLSIGNKYSSNDLFDYLQSDDNIFQQYFEYAQDKILGSPETRYYLFSLVVLDQLGPALAFSREIKKVYPNAKIVFGGSMVSRFYKKLVSISWLSEIVDDIIPGEAYKSVRKMFGIQKCWDGHITPDFSDFDMNKYLSPRLVLPYLVAHGCKWGLCTFCSHHLTYSKYRASDLQKVVEDISQLVKKYDVEYISFSDEFLTAEQLDEIANLLMAKKINVRWSTFVRAEPKFADKNFTKKLYENGARLLMFGFESVSQRILKLMKKGVDTRFYVPILEACKEANIAIRLDFMIGFPGEHVDEIQHTFSFVKNNSSVIDTPFSSCAVAVFELREDIPIMKNMKISGTQVFARLRGDLDEQYDFVENKGLSSEKKQQWRHEIIKYLKNESNAELIAPQNKTHQLVLKDSYDKSLLSLPTTIKLNTENLCDFVGIWNNGVVVSTVSGDSNIQVPNYATGGELIISSELATMVENMKQGISLYSTFSNYKDWNLSEFIKLINFLCRNDYLLVRNPQETVKRVETVNEKISLFNSYI